MKYYNEPLTMKEGKAITVALIFVVIHMSLAVEMDTFARSFDHRGDQNIKNERPIIGTLLKITKRKK